MGGNADEEETKNHTCAKRLAPTTATAALAQVPPLPPERSPPTAVYLNSVAFSPSRSQVYIRGERRQTAEMERLRTIKRTPGYWKVFPEPVSYLCGNPISIHSSQQPEEKEEGENSGETVEGDRSMVRFGGHGCGQTAAICCCGELSPRPLDWLEEPCEVHVSDNVYCFSFHPQSTMSTSTIRRLLSLLFSHSPYAASSTWSQGRLH